MRKHIIGKFGLVAVLVLIGCDDDNGTETATCEHECVLEEYCGEPHILHEDMTCEGEYDFCCEMVTAPTDTSSASGSDTAVVGTPTDTTTTAPPPSDTGTGSAAPPSDTGTGNPPTDTGTPASDTGSSSDTGTGGVASDTEVDASTPPVDAGTPTDTATMNSGYTCAEAITVDALPFTHSGSTVGAGNEYSVDGSCTGMSISAGGASEETVYFFIPEITAVYTVTVDQQNGYDAAVYVTTACVDVNASCVQGADRTQSGSETVQMILEDGRPYFVIVDGWSDSANVAGSYSITIDGPCVPSCDGRSCGSDGCGSSCGSCPAGEVCDDTAGTCQTDTTAGNSCEYPYEVGALPFAYTDDTTGMQNLYGVQIGECAGIDEEIGTGSNDSVYRFTPTVTGRYTFSVSDDLFDNAIYVVTDCAAISTACVGGVDTTGEGETLVLDLTADTTYYVVVDGHDTDLNRVGAYSLTISDVCVPDCDQKDCGTDSCGGSCGACDWTTEICNWSQVCETYTGVGDDCYSTFTIDPSSLPFSVLSDLTLPRDTISVAGDACPGANQGVRHGGADSDEIYSFAPAASGYYTITVDSYFSSEIRWNSVHYVVTDCQNPDTSCIGVKSDDLGPDPEMLTVELEADSTYYIVVDGSDASDEGPYELTVSDVCVPNCDGKQCGPSGCENCSITDSDGNCTGITCGECEAGYECDDTSGLCQEVLEPGDTCNSAFVIQPSQLPYSDTGDTSLLQPRYSLDTNCGSPNSLGGGATSSDVVYSFTPEVTGVYTVVGAALEGEYSGFDNILYIVTDCTDTDNTCVTADRNTNASESRPTTVRAILEAGTTYYMIFDGYSSMSNFDGPYTFSLSEPCVRTCDGTDGNPDLQCGDDGCGFEPCGTCLGDDFCNDDQMCETYTGLGDTCDNPYLVDELPFVVYRDTTLAENDMSFSVDQCPGEGSAGGGSDDEVYEFTPTVSGAYTIRLSQDPRIFYGSLYIVTDCSDVANTCLIANSDTGEQEISIKLDGGTTYYIVVDGWSNSSNGAGAYMLEIEEPCIPACDGKNCGEDGCGFDCGECIPGNYCDETQNCAPYSNSGDSCLNPFVVNTNPYSTTGDTSGTDFNNVYATTSDTCDDIYAEGGESNEVVYQYTPEATGYYTVATEGDFNIAMYVVTDCTNMDDTCFAGVDQNSSDGTESMELYLEAGTAYYFIVDGGSSVSVLEGAYTFSISEVCVPVCEGKQCGDDGCGHRCETQCDMGSYCIEETFTCEDYDDIEGDSCHNPIAIDPVNLPFEGTYQYVEDTNNAYYVESGHCEGLSSHGSEANDVAYAFTPTESGDYRITLNMSYTAAVYVTTDCTDIATSCVGGAYSNPESMEMDVTLEADTTYYLIVDGYGSSTPDGNHTLDLCKPDCGGGARVCGDDGCGGSCGECDGGYMCTDSGTCVVSTIPGDICSTAIEIASGDIPYSHTGDTSTLSNAYSVNASECAAGTTGIIGDSADEAVYRFTPATDGTYTITVDSSLDGNENFDAVVYVFTDCLDIAGTCPYASDSVGSSSNESFSVSMTGGTSYYIVVDGWYYYSSGVYTLSVDI